MTASYSNLQIRTSDQAAVRMAIEALNLGSVKILARTQDNWIGIYPFLTEDDYAYLKDYAIRMSTHVKVPVFGFIVLESGTLQYVFCEKGAVLDEYSSNAHAQEPASGGDIDRLLPLCKSGTSRSDLKKLLHISSHAPRKKDSISSGDRIASGLANFLCIPRAQMCTGYNHLKWAQAGR